MSTRVAVTCGLVLFAAACGTSSGDDDALPSRQIKEFTVGAFDDLPRFPRGEPVGQLTEQEGGRLVRSFLAPGTTPVRVLDYYQRQLRSQGWEVAIAPRTVGPETSRGRWTKDGFRLRVSAAPAPALGFDDAATGEAIVQYSLTLNPPGRDPGS